jgi:protein tyrosine/serine phosphatase
MSRSQFDRAQSPACIKSTGIHNKDMIHNALRFAAISFAAVLVLTVASFSQTSPSKDFPNVKISNFGKMDEHFYRGARPKTKDLAALKELGIHTVIDLTENSKDEKESVESLGMKYVNIPIVDKSYPTEENVAAFLKTIDDADTGIFYVHCAGGRHRTGDMGALYRFTKYAWDFDKVYKEMENYDFYTSRGHQKAKDFVVDYAAKMAATAAVTKP